MKATDSSYGQKVRLSSSAHIAVVSTAESAQEPTNIRSARTRI